MTGKICQVPVITPLITVLEWDAGAPEGVNFGARGHRNLCPVTTLDAQRLSLAISFEIISE